MGLRQAPPGTNPWIRQRVRTASCLPDTSRLAAREPGRLGPMPDPSPILAVYGTLRRGEANGGLLDPARFLGTGRVAGQLRVMPRSTVRAYAYPALILDGSGPVVVEIYALTDTASLAQVDRLEAYDPADEPASEYVRRLLPIVGGPVSEAWVYVYNGPRSALGEAIPDGDWIADRHRGAP